jgi:hypothetical protein
MHYVYTASPTPTCGDTVEARPGTWVQMPKGLRHSIQAKTPVVMLLLLVKELRP